MAEVDPAYIPPPQPPLVDFTEPEKPVDDDTVAPMPVWASILVILLSLSAGGWIVKWYVGTDMLQQESMVLDANPPALTPRNRIIEPPVRQPNATTTLIDSQLAELVIDHQPKKSPVVRAINYRNRAAISPELAQLRSTVNRIRNDTATQKYLGVTPDQLRQWSRVGQIPMVTKPGDFDQLLSLYLAYESAKDKGPALTSLQSTMDAMAKQGLAPTKAAAAQAVTKLRAVLTPEQWSKLEKMGR